METLKLNENFLVYDSKYFIGLSSIRFISKNDKFNYYDYGINPLLIKDINDNFLNVKKVEIKNVDDVFVYNDEYIIYDNYGKYIEVIFYKNVSGFKICGVSEINNIIKRYNYLPVIYKVKNNKVSLLKKFDDTYKNIKSNAYIITGLVLFTLNNIISINNNKLIVNSFVFPKKDLALSVIDKTIRIIKNNIYYNNNVDLLINFILSNYGNNILTINGL